MELNLNIENETAIKNNNLDNATKTPLISVIAMVHGGRDPSVTTIA